MVAHTVAPQAPLAGGSRSRRAHERFEVTLAVLVEHAGRTLSGTSRNLSLGGMFLDLHGTIPFGATVILKFSVPTRREPFVAPATVRWTEGASGHGVQFGRLRARDVWDLQQLLVAVRR